MSVKIYTKVARPPLLLGGSPKATLLNLGLSLMGYCLLGVDLSVFVFFVFMQVFIFYKTYKNPYFFAQILASISCRNKNATAKTFKGETYVP